MADYTKLMEAAQQMFTEMLEACRKKIKNFNSYKVDPTLHFEDRVTRLGYCKYIRDDESDYKYKIYLSKMVLPAGNRIPKETLAHELAHVISTKGGHGKEFKLAVKTIDEMLGTNSECCSDIDSMIIDEGLREFDKELYKKHREYLDKKEAKRLERERKKQEQLKKDYERMRQKQIEYFGHELGNIPHI